MGKMGQSSEEIDLNDREVHPHNSYIYHDHANINYDEYGEYFIQITAFAKNSYGSSGETSKKSHLILKPNDKPGCPTPHPSSYSKPYPKPYPHPTGKGKGGGAYLCGNEMCPNHCGCEWQCKYPKGCKHYCLCQGGKGKGKGGNRHQFQPQHPTPHNHHEQQREGKGGLSHYSTFQGSHNHLPKGKRYGKGKGDYGKGKGDYGKGNGIYGKGEGVYGKGKGVYGKGKGYSIGKKGHASLSLEQTESSGSISKHYEYLDDYYVGTRRRVLSMK